MRNLSSIATCLSASLPRQQDLLQLACTNSPQHPHPPPPPVLRHMATQWLITVHNYRGVSSEKHKHTARCRAVFLSNLLLLPPLPCGESISCLCTIMLLPCYVHLKHAASSTLPLRQTTKQQFRRAAEGRTKIHKTPFPNACAVLGRCPALSASQSPL